MDELAPETTKPIEPPSFDDQPQVGQVELDRYCVRCGYNLRQQAVRREPATRLLLCKCPECGSFEPANQAMTRPKSWFGQLVLLLWLVWIAALGGAVAGAIGGTARLSYQAGELLSETESLDTPIPDPRDTTGNSVRMISFQYQVQELDAENTVMLISVLLGSFATALGLLSLFLIFVPHWRRRAYVILALGWPIVSLIGSYTAHLVDNYTLAYATDGLAMWIYLSPLLITFFAFAGGLTGVCLSRPIARLIVRIVIPSRQRGPFAYLWLVDGKVPKSPQ